MTESHALGEDRPQPKKDSASGRDLIGKNLGKYYIAERLSQGGTAAVYKAYQAGLSRYVAIKVLHNHLTADESFVERFEHEAIAVAGLRHPNIVQVFDFDLAVDLYYMVMEFIEGPTLEARLVELNQQEARLPLATVVDIINALASAIDYAHSRGMIHRDLKPSNVMFTGDDKMILTDFGIAHIVEGPRYTATGDITGTPAYMSPEQAQGKRVDERTDVYSLGVILYEMVTGRLPFEGDTPLTVLMKHVNEPVPMPTQLNPQLAPAVETVVLKAMAKDSNGRYQTAAELAQALQAAVLTSPAAETIASVEAATGLPGQAKPTQPPSGSMAEHLIGQQLAGRYQVLNLLGSGGMGTVFKGYDETLRRDVAIKVMHPHVATHETLRQRFVQEARAAARLSHPAIGHVFDFGQAGDFLFIVLEFIPGHTLSRILRDLRGSGRWIRLSEAVQLTRHVCTALHYAHRQQVLHRDIKPNNIMLKPQPGESLPYQPVVMDLGLAKIIGGENLTIAGASLGTPAYMSPEQAAGETVDARSDIYSVGVLLYELCVGCLPFPVKTIPEAIRYHLNEPPPPPRSRRPDLPETLEQLILTALAKAPADRFADASAMAQALAAVLPDAAQVSAAPESSDKAISLIETTRPDYNPFEIPEIKIAGQGQPGGSAFYAGDVGGDLVYGDKIGGDKIQVGHISGSGVAIGRGAQVSMSQGVGGDTLAQIFSLIFQKIEARPLDPDVEKEEIIDVVSKIQQEVAKGEAANPRKTERWVNNLNDIAPDIAQATADGLLTPTVTVSPPIRQIAAKAGSTGA